MTHPVCDNELMLTNAYVFTFSVLWQSGVFFHRLVSDSVRDQLMVTIQKTFNYSRSHAQQIYLMVMECMKKKALVGQTGY